MDKRTILRFEAVMLFVIAAALLWVESYRNIQWLMFPALFLAILGARQIAESKKVKG